MPKFTWILRENPTTRLESIDRKLLFRGERWLRKQQNVRPVLLTVSSSRMRHFRLEEILAGLKPRWANSVSGITRAPVTTHELPNIWRRQGHEDNNDETSWCSAFVNWTLAQNAIRGTNNAAARSWLNFGQRIVEPQPGCIVILWRESPQSWKGHVGFFAGWDVGHRIRLLAGNQGGGSDWDEVCVTNFPDERILGFRWPTGV